MLLVLGRTALTAAQFEGTIHWRVSGGGGGAAGEMQAQLSQGIAALDSPEMKAMLAQNPQMKAAMEKQLAAQAKARNDAGAGSGALGGLMPSAITMYLQDGNTMVSTKGGMAPRDVLSLPAKGLAYVIDPATRTYSRLPANLAHGQGGTAQSFKVTRTSETTQLLGYTCTRYEVVSGGFEDVTFSIWVTPEVKGIDQRQLAMLQLGGDQSAGFLRDVNGVPLRMIVSTPLGKIQLDVTAIKAEPVPAARVAVPAGYTETAALPTL
jgi:hypothetical protein